MSRNLLVGLLLAATATTSAPALEIPLTVAERAGVRRAGNHVNAGIPLPRGAVGNVGALGLFDAEGKGVPAAFVVRQNWLQDGSVRWATVHFLTDAPANGQVRYVVRDKPGPAPAYPVRAEAAADRVTIDTGAVKFTVTRENFNVLDAVWFDATGRGNYGPPVVEPGSARLVANIASGDYKVVSRVASVNQVGPAGDAKAYVALLELEEHTPVRAVVRATGQLMRGDEPTLDFTCRIYAMASSPAVRVSFSVVNRTAKKWADFHGINELSLEVPLKTAGPLRYGLSAGEGDDLSGPIGPGQSATILQPYSEHYFLGGVASGQGKAKSLLTRRLGWASLSGADAAVTVAIRYFWQMHPKGLAVRGDGSVAASLVPLQEKAVTVPEGITSQADTRIDLFCGGARTHELLVAFHAPSDSPAPVALGVVDPLLAACPPAWYCQGTGVQGPLWDANIENFRPEHRELVAAYQKKIAEVFEECAGAVRRGGRRGTEEYGWMSFGSGTEARGANHITPNDWLNTRWDGNYYDFPRAVLVNFWRTGELKYWDVAQNSALHLADIDIAHFHPTNPKLIGIEHTCPNRGHFRQWWRSEPFGVSGNMDSSKSQSLYDLYRMTGDRWFLECGLLVAGYSMNHSGGALRAVANRSTNLREAFEQTGDKKYWDENAAWLQHRLLGRTAEQRWDQHWMYGMASEVLTDAYRISGEAKYAQAAVRCADSLIRNFWKDDKATVRPLTGFTLITFGHAYEYTADPEYLRKGLLTLQATVDEYAGSVKTFAQAFRISPYFLAYLVRDYRPPPPLAEPNP